DEHEARSGPTQADKQRGARPTLAMSPGSPSGDAPASERALSLAPGVEVHLKPTVVRPEPPAAESGRKVPATEPTTRFTTVEKRANKGDTQTDRYLWLKLSALGLVIAIFFSGVGYALWPPSADTLYRQISQAAATGESRQLAEVETAIERFLNRFPTDTRAAEVAAWKED